MSPSSSHVEVVQHRNIRTVASSEVGRGVDLTWSSYLDELNAILDRLDGPEDLHSWFETPDVAFPAAHVLEVIPAEIIEDSQADTFRFTATDFDAWV